MDSMKKAFFLDRDGTINIDTGYVGNVADVKLIEGAGEAIRMMNQAGYLVLVISNQSGIARGYMTMKDAIAVNAEINHQLEKYDAHIDKFYMCPHYEQGSVAQYSIPCNCRKPNLGLFKEAIKENNIDVTASVAVGDKLRDVEKVGELGITITCVLGEDNYSNLYEFTKAVLGD